MKRKINPEIDVNFIKRQLIHELTRYDERLQNKQPNMYRLGLLFQAAENVFNRLNENSTAEEIKKLLTTYFSFPPIPPVKKILKLLDNERSNKK